MLDLFMQQPGPCLICVCNNLDHAWSVYTTTWTILDLYMQQPGPCLICTCINQDHAWSVYATTWTMLDLWTHKPGPCLICVPTFWTMLCTYNLKCTRTQLQYCNLQYDNSVRFWWLDFFISQAFCGTYPNVQYRRYRQTIFCRCLLQYFVMNNWKDDNVLSVESVITVPWINMRTT